MLLEWLWGESLRVPGRRFPKPELPFPIPEKAGEEVTGR